MYITSEDKIINKDISNNNLLLKIKLIGFSPLVLSFVSLKYLIRNKNTKTTDNIKFTSLMIV